MATTKPSTPNRDLVDQCQEFLALSYREEIAELAQSYPQEQRSLIVSHGDLFKFDPQIADDALTQPATVISALETALPDVELPVDVDLAGAHVRLSDLPDLETYYPGEFSPSKHEGSLRDIQGEVSKVTDVYSKMQMAAFECQRCGTLVRIAQDDTGFQEPHECSGCERQGPFEINYSQSEFVDGQKLRIQTPPEEAQGEGQDLDVYVEDDLAGRVTAGDRVTATGQIQLEQQGSDRQKRNKFEPYADAQSLTVEETDIDDIDISAEQRQEIDALASGDEGEPLDLAAESLAPKIYGYHDIKRAIILALVGGSRVEYSGQDFDRGEFHVLLIGDPSTGKSKLVDRAEQIGWRSVGVSGSGATKAGVTAAAVQDDFGEGDWTLDAGAAVKAHRGVLAIDELDDMPEEVRSALLEPMSKQTIHITKGGINTHLQTQAAVVAAANPEHDRFDPYQPIAEQFAFSSTLLSRFDLVYTFQDVPDADEDAKIARHILENRDAAKRLETGSPDDLDTDPRPPIEAKLLRAWIALAKQQPKPVFADEDVSETIQDAFTDLRGMYGYDNDDDPIPVTHRSLEGIVRVAEAAAKFEFSDTIDERHVAIATDLVGKSMHDIGKDPETGKLDADVHESGASKAQKDRRNALVETIDELQRESDESGASIETVVRELDYSESQIRSDIQQLKDSGDAYNPEDGYVRYIP